MSTSPSSLADIVLIQIKGASEHNLKQIDANFGDGLTAVTGVSGSGKTSLVFDTLYHEAKRRFLAIYSLGSPGLRLAPAKVRSITGLGPAVAVGQNLLNRNPNSTMATASGLHPFLRVLYARFGERQCARCGGILSLQTEDEIVSRIRELWSGEPLTVIAPLVQGVAGSHGMLLATLTGSLPSDCVVVDGFRERWGDLSAEEPHDIAVVVGEFSERAGAHEIRRAVGEAKALGAHSILVELSDRRERHALAPVCSRCGEWFSQLEPTHFRDSCPFCSAAGCVQCSQTGMLPQAAATRWQNLRLPDLLSFTVSDAEALFKSAHIPSVAARLEWEITRRLRTMLQLGLGYITLDRSSPTLSRGEAQRLRLAVALTGRLEDLLYVLDEPTVGQHMVDVERLLPALRELRGPVVYVEHDREAVAAADEVIDLGPGAGAEGGHSLFAGAPADLWRSETMTGRYFSLREAVESPRLRAPPDRFLRIVHARQHNLQGIDLRIPLERLTVVTGVSGSGKSTLVEDVLVASLRAGEPVCCDDVSGPYLKPTLVDQKPIGRNPRSNPATYTKLSDVIRDLFSSGTGLSPSHFSFNRQEGACGICRGMGAVEVRMRYLPSIWIPCGACDGKRFSDEVLNVSLKIDGAELSIADFYELSVDEAHLLLLEAPLLSSKQREASDTMLRALRDVGLGYLHLGQPSPTLSGGEAQRVKLAKFLGRRSLRTQMFVLDEPSTGLHPKDLNGLLKILDRLVRAGATGIVVEHNADIIRAADWVVDLGPGAGPEGGRLIYEGPPSGLTDLAASATGCALKSEKALIPKSRTAPSTSRRTPYIKIEGAWAHNLQGIHVAFEKGKMTVVTGVSGSGKSTLVEHVLETEARRRFLETLSLYERQGIQEGPEPAVDSVTGLGVTVSITPERRVYDRRATVGTATELTHHLAAILACTGKRRCTSCGNAMKRSAFWHCHSCGATARLAEPRHFLQSTYAAACLSCHGVGTLQIPNPSKLIVHPDKPLCGGAMHSPGFFPQGYLCKPFNGGYDMVQALASRYAFDPATTPWSEMTKEAREAFLHGDPDPMDVTYTSRNGRSRTVRQRFPGFYGWIRDWDVGGTYTDTRICEACGGAGLRPEFLAVTLDGSRTMHDLSSMSLEELQDVVTAIPVAERAKVLIDSGLVTAQQRLRFLNRIGLGYLDLNRVTGSLSAGEAQRVRLAGLLGSGLSSLTVVLDEPTRGLHPSEVLAMVQTLSELRMEGNTVIVVEHDPHLIRAADHVVDLGPGAGKRGGRVVAQGTPDQVGRCDTITGSWLRGERRIQTSRPRRRPSATPMRIHGARAHNLRCDTVDLPRRILVGICGVSGSGKSSLLIDTIGRALAVRKQTTSVAREPIDPGEHDRIEGAPKRTIIVDQTRASVNRPVDYLGLAAPLRGLYAASEDARAIGIDAAQLQQRCTSCSGRGNIVVDMGFLPDVHAPCETCRGTGCRAEAWEIHVNGMSLPETYQLTIDDALARFREEERITGPLKAAHDVGLGYLVLSQPRHALSGGECQRLKLAREFWRLGPSETLFILDEPTVGQHMDDIARLVDILHIVVDRGNSVFVIEHQPNLLASCDWLVELGPGGGPAGGQIIATGTPEKVARGDSPIAPYLREVLCGSDA